MRLLHIAVLRHGEDDQHEQDVLAGADDLCVGKTFFGIEDESTDPAECADIGKHGAGNVGAAIQPARETAGKAEAADGTGDKDEQEPENRDDEQAPGDGQDPEAQQ